MKRINLNEFVITRVSMLLTIYLVTTIPAFGDYEIVRSTIDGGGGMSSSGQYMLTGTIAQHDAAYSKGEPYELLGGFWPGEPTCTVNFEHFARFAQHWLETGTDSPADLYKDTDDIVNEFDLNEFVDYWLCYCPYNWPLK